MTIEEFKRYKKIAESKDYELLNTFPEAQKVYQWMEDTGRVDEGFWGAVWSWLKKNFSPTARKLHKLANDFEKEYTAESRAEYGTMKNSKDLAAKFRRSFAGKVSEEIEEKMSIVAGDDDDYRELSRLLINKKKLKVKKSMIIEFSGNLDPEDAEEMIQDTTKKESVNDSKMDGVIRKLTNQPKIKEINEELRKKVFSSKNTYAELGYDTTEKLEKLIGVIICYQNALEIKGKVEFNSKTAKKTLDDFAKFVIEGARKIQKGNITKQQAISAIVNVTETMMKDENPLTFEKMRSEVYKRAEDSLKNTTKRENTSTNADAENDAKEEVTGPATPTIISDNVVKNTIKDAAEETGEKTPTSEEIVEEIKQAAKNYFEENSDKILKELTKNVEDFNSLSEENRKNEQNKFNYDLDKNNKLKIPTPESIKSLFNNFTQLAGAIVPYFNMKKGQSSRAFIIAKHYRFEIYAVKKNEKGELTQNDIDTIIYNIKKKYPKS